MLKYLVPSGYVVVLRHKGGIGTNYVVEVPWLEEPCMRSDIVAQLWGVIADGYFWGV